MPHHARNHNQNRRRVCIVCMNKGKDTISELVLSRITKYVKGLEHYDPVDPRFPNAICGNCRNLLADIADGNNKSAQLPEIFNYYEYIMNSFIENSSKCKCFICQTARKNFPYQKV